MMRINTSINVQIAQRTHAFQTKGLQTSLERLSTSLRINSAADDPSGLVASEFLRAEKRALSQAISNGERADTLVAIAHGSLNEIQFQLQELESLVDTVANTDGLIPEEHEALQQKADSILSTIDRIAQQTKFQDISLLDGRFEFVTSGVRQSELDDVDVHGALIPAFDSRGNAGSVSVNVLVAQSAQHAYGYISAGGTFSGQTVTFEFAGSYGNTQLSFGSGTTVTTAVNSINQFSELTGLEATSANSGGGILVRSSEVGSSHFVSVRHVAGGAYENRIHDVTSADGTVTNITIDDQKQRLNSIGRNAEIHINGVRAGVLGINASQSNPHLNLSIQLDEAFNVTGNSTTFDIVSGGARFNIGTEAKLGSKMGVAFKATTTGSLGSATNGRLAALKSGSSANLIGGDVERAQRIVRDAIRQVALERGRLGSFATNSLRVAINAHELGFERTAASESQIRDTDYAKESAVLVRQQIFVQSATQALQVTQARSADVLSLLQ